jgi:hypothetical protein
VTTLAVTSAGSPVTTAASGSVVTLTAMVTAGGTPVTVGQVNFCDASAAYCTDIHLLGTAQLTKAGTAVYRFRPGVGSQSYKAVFVGTRTHRTSTSSVAGLAVSGSTSTVLSIAQSGTPGNQQLTPTVGGAGGASPSGTVFFLDITNGNAVLDAAVLSNNVPGLNFINSSSPVTATPYSIVIGGY